MTRRFLKGTIRSSSPDREDELSDDANKCDRSPAAFDSRTGEELEGLLDTAALPLRWRNKFWMIVSVDVDDAIEKAASKSLFRCCSAAEFRSEGEDEWRTAATKSCRDWAEALREPGK